MKKITSRCQKCGKREFEVECLYSAGGIVKQNNIIIEPNFTLVHVNCICSCGHTWNPNKNNKDTKKKLKKSTKHLIDYYFKEKEKE